MNITEIKSALKTSTLNLNTANDIAGLPTSWMRHWDNDARVAVSIHKELIAEIKANPAISTLGLQTETRSGSQGVYTAHRIVKYKPAESTL